jgi:hypothetical protein
MWAQDGITLVTIFMPTAEIENMSNAQFVALLETERLITWEPGAQKFADARRFVDAAGAPICSVNVVRGRGPAICSLWLRRAVLPLS